MDYATESLVTVNSSMYCYRLRALPSFGVHRASKKKSRAKKRAPPKALGAPLIVCDLHHELCRKGGTARSDNVVIEGYT